jgi:pimeloyl-ACP methyl ester carboxylesterase
MGVFIRWVLIVLLGLAGCGTLPDARGPDQPTVVLLHGLGRGDRSMKPLAASLSDAGFRVVNLEYPTRGRPDELIGLLDIELRSCCAMTSQLNFVAHSLGGILVRAYLAYHEPPNLGRVVMLAPPNHGSEIADLARKPIFAWAVGPIVRDLGTNRDSLPNRLPAPYYEVGVIAGNRTLNPVGSALIPGPDDGAVSVERTRLDGMTDFITLPHSHTFIMRADEAAAQTEHFLRYGRFLHGKQL